MYRILVINPGSTSTKVAVYDDDKALFVQTLDHIQDSSAPSKNIFDQFELRRDLVLKALRENNIDSKSLSAVAGRGGLLPPPVHSGAYEVNQAMLDQLRHKPVMEHASNLGAPIAQAIAAPLGRKAYVYDPVTVDEMDDLMRITGLPHISRKAVGHNLNMRASAIRYAKENGLDYHQLSLIVAHLGGGITLSLHHQGRMIDFIGDDEGPFSPERAGGLPAYQLAELSIDVGDLKDVVKILRTKGGLMAWFGTTEGRNVEDMIDRGDQKAAMVYEAMALAVAKNVAKLAASAKGRVDKIILTGGLAYSKRFTGWISERVCFVAPVVLMPGENEMEALALGTLRVLSGEEKARTFFSPDFS